jgi:anti-anti-sigma factor
MDERAAVLVVGGELDLATASQLDRALVTVCSSAAPRVVIDTGEVAFCDITTLQRLLATGSRLQTAGRQLVLRHPSRMLVRLVDLIAPNPPFLVERDGAARGGNGRRRPMIP